MCVLASLQSNARRPMRWGAGDGSEGVAGKKVQGKLKGRSKYTTEAVGLNGEPFYSCPFSPTAISTRSLAMIFLLQEECKSWSYIVPLEQFLLSAAVTEPTGANVNILFLFYCFFCLTQWTHCSPSCEQSPRLLFTWYPGLNPFEPVCVKRFHFCQFT